MPQFLSDEWVAALSQALAGNATLTDALANSDGLVIQYEVDDHRHQVHLGPSGATAEPGSPQTPKVTFSQSLETARAVATGELSSEEAFITGRITCTGDVQLLLDHSEAVAKVGDIAASMQLPAGAPE